MVFDTSQPARLDPAKPEAPKAPGLAAAVSKPEAAKPSVAKADSPTAEAPKTLPKKPEPAVAATTKPVAKREAPAASTPEARKPAAKKPAAKKANTVSVTADQLHQLEIVTGNDSAISVVGQVRNIGDRGVGMETTEALPVG